MTFRFALVRFVLLFLALSFAGSARADSPRGPVLFAARAGVGADDGAAGIGPGVSLEAHVLGDHWVAGVRTDGAWRRLFLSDAQELAVQGEVGFLLPLGPVRFQATATSGVTWAQFEKAAFCGPLDPDAACTPSVREARVRPEVGGSLGVVSQRGNLWVGLRGRIGTPAILLGISFGPSFGGARAGRP